MLSQVNIVAKFQRPFLTETASCARTMEEKYGELFCSRVQSFTKELDMSFCLVSFTAIFDASRLV